MSEREHAEDGLRALYRRGRSEEPSAALDDAILAAARERARYRTRRQRSILVPLAAAATILLVAGVSLQLLDPGTEQAPRQPAAVQREEAARPTPDARSVDRDLARAIPPPAAPPAGQLAGSRPAPVAASAPPRARLAEKRATHDTFKSTAAADAPAGKQAADAGGAREQDRPATRRRTDAQPRFAFDPGALRERYPAMRVATPSGDLIELHAGDTIAMRLQRSGQRIRIDAWPAARALGVRAPWGSSAAAAAGCTSGDGLIFCPIDGTYLGAYRKGDLVFVRWWQ